MNKKLKVCVAGASGFVGQELIKLLVKHPHVEIIHLFVNNLESQDTELIKKHKLPDFKKIDIKLINDCDVLFSAMPHTHSQSIIKSVSEKLVILDLSADFRLSNAETYENWYNVKHESKDLLKKAVYGLSEIFRDEIKKSNLIACPGCYPTSILLPLIPLLKENLINTNEIIIDSKSGYSGAGKKTLDIELYPQIEKNIATYGLSNHRHVPEIEEYLNTYIDNKTQINFTPHLIPTFRGILSTIYIKSNFNLIKLSECLLNFYRNSEFIRFYKKKLINTNEVINTNYCNISINENRLPNSFIISSSIDNLLKGASGQAVQNFNIRFDFEENLSLT